MLGFNILVIILIGFGAGFAAQAKTVTEHQLVRRMTVFPLQTEVKQRKLAEGAWWDIREALTDNKRFLVASKNFMKNKDVFQPRGELAPADAIILSRLLDAHALVTTFLVERRLQMHVYEGVYGRLLWHREISLHPSLPVEQQLSTAGLKLIHDFIASIPYQGHVVVDEMIGRVVIKRQDKRFVRVKVGIDSKVEKGDAVQFLKVTTESIRPIFEGAAQIDIVGEGLVSEVKRGTITVEVTRAENWDAFQEETLVRLPKDFKRLQESFAIRESVYKNIDPEYLDSKKVELQEKYREKKPLVASLAFIANMALMLLLAF